MLPFVCGGYQGDASVIAEPGLLDFHQLRHFGIRSVELLELLESGGPHPGLVQRTIIGQRMLMASNREEDTDTEKQGARLHTFIVARATTVARRCAVEG